MAGTSSWSETRGGGYRLPGPDHLGWWAAVAMLLSVLLHVVVFFMLDRWKLEFGEPVAQEISTRPMVVRQPEEVADVTSAETLPPEEVIQPPKDTSKLLDDIELLEALPKNQELDIKPQQLDPEFALRMEKPAREGSPDALAPEASNGFDVQPDLPELGRMPDTIKPAELGQLTVDPGVAQPEETGLGKFTDDVIRKGANGKVAEGSLDGVTSLDKLLDLPPNVLIGKKTMLPSDLLFEYNSSELRESAKVGLMKLALLIDRNPDLFCWIEGHTDLIGGDEYNLNLSVKRADAVKRYLVDSLRMNPTKIVTRGFGRFEPIITAGTADEQSPNRRVEIKMRREPPTKEQMKIEPKKAAVIEEAPAPKAVLVKPKRALPVEEPPAPTPPPARATPVEEMPELPQVPKAAPVERATPVDEPARAIPRAEAVEE